jgi:DNA-directed RNA polymerase subunit RPC12/RpoP
MKKHYLHLSVYRCDKCEGPVVTGSLAVRETQISKETEQREIGAICLSCGHRRSLAREALSAHHLPPIEWRPAGVINSGDLATAFVEALNRDLH